MHPGSPSIVVLRSVSGREAPLTQRRPHQRRGSRPRLPTSAGNDNETLDHLLSELVAGGDI